MFDRAMCATPQALAQYTDRSIISIPLAKIKTNQELMDIVFDQNFAVVGEALSSKLPFSRTVFVMVRDATFCRL